MYYHVKDTSYWYETYGEGIPIVLLHGFTGSSDSWNDLIALYPKEFQWIVVDLPGHGKTKTKGIKKMEACCRDLYGLFQSLEMERFYLLGYSMGGRTALTYAKIYPNTLQGLILESSSPGLETIAEREARIEQDAKIIERIETEGIDGFIRFWENIPLFSTQKALPTVTQNKIRNNRLKSSREGLIQSLKGMGTGAQASNWEALKDVSIPTLLIVGSLDEKYVQLNQKMQKMLPNVILQEVDGAGHTIHVEKLVTYGKIITCFMKQHADNKNDSFT